MPRTGRGKNGNGKKGMVYAGVKKLLALLPPGTPIKAIKEAMEVIKRDNGSITKKEKDQILNETIKTLNSKEQHLYREIGKTGGMQNGESPIGSTLPLLGGEYAGGLPESGKTTPTVSVEMTETSRKIHEEQNKNNNKDKKKRSGKDKRGKRNR